MNLSLTTGFIRISLQGFLMSIQIMNFVALGPRPLKGGLKVGVILPKSQANESYIVRNVSNMFLTLSDLRCI